MLFKMFFILYLLMSSIALCAESKPFKVILFSPQHNDEDYWGNLHDFARASAKDLGINFSVNYNTSGNAKVVGSRYDYIESIERVLKSKNKPDAFMAALFKTKEVELLALAQKYNTPLMLINSKLTTRLKNIIGAPRSKYKYYIGQISPDSEQMSYLLSNHLLNSVKIDNSKTIEVVAIAGARDGPSHNHRVQGLQRAVKEKNNARLNQIVFGNWDEKRAFQLSTKLIHRYADLHMIWCSSDLMALGAQRAINNSNQHIITGGFDWTSNAITSIQSGQLTASVGGPFTNAGFGMVLLYDYLHGKDFADVASSTIKTKGALIHKSNVDKYAPFLLEKDWGSVDFKKYSRIYHPENKGYNFSLDYLLGNSKAIN